MQFKPRRLKYARMQPRGRAEKYKNAIIEECCPLALQQKKSINISENRDSMTMVEFQH